MTRGAGQLPLDLRLPRRTSSGRGDFMLSASNRDAMAWIDRTGEWPGGTLILVGPEGSGKTHLAHVWMAQTDARIVEARMADPGAACDPGAEAPDGRASGVIVDSLEGLLHLPLDRRVEAEKRLLHLYNRTRAREGKLLVCTRVAPAALAFNLADLASRLRAGLCCALHEPDEKLLASIMLKLFADRQVRVSHRVVEYAALRIERSFAAARDLVAYLDALSLARGSAVTIPLAREVLARMPERGAAQDADRMTGGN